MLLFGNIAIYRYLPHKLYSEAVNICRNPEMTLPEKQLERLGNQVGQVQMTLGRDLLKKTIIIIIIII